MLNAGAYTHTSIAIHDAIRASRRCRSWKCIFPTFTRANPSATCPWSRPSRVGHDLRLRAARLHAGAAGAGGAALTDQTKKRL